ncbi:hypothetical protein GPX89_26715 [Nocardia sp. ET3-3]|uniref:DUF4913 domain-containing protein n=1 Tax=Nocardia terrae TaxID=2675851 RepID=A0A7K1V2G5_9NOCA|nr:hypothetical protein [Nocardia terrae]MVU80833.1 hypothetical protein [Nocardia terrae]
MNSPLAQPDREADGSSSRLWPCRYSWRDLDQQGAAQLWTELIDWVDWLRHRYQLGSRVPACWYRHDSVVEELTALMAAHSAAYRCDRDAIDLPREDLTAWHTQWLWPVMERLTRNSDFSACRPHHCRSQNHPQPVHADLEGFVAEDIATHVPRTAEPTIGGR